MFKAGTTTPAPPRHPAFGSENEQKTAYSLLSRNLWWKLLSGNELQIERLSFFCEPFDALEPELFFVVFDTLFDIVLPVTQHTIDQPCQMMGHGDDRLGRAGALGLRADRPNRLSAAF
jgi:hypothetical protein